MRELSVRRRAMVPRETLVIDTQFSTSSCSNMPDEPKHMRYALYDAALYQAGARRSTANHDSTSVSVLDTGCHCRTEMKGTTVPAASICGQLCTKLRLGN